jgi:alpha-glucosidase
MPRFSIHSWNDDRTVNEPWMHPNATPSVRELIKLRYRLIPYLYNLLWRYHRAYEPVVRPTFFDFPDDPQCWREGDEMMVGPSLLVAPVVEAGQLQREVYLPFGAHWYDFWSGEVFKGGQTITRPAPWTRPVLFARESSAIPVNVAAQTFAARVDRRSFMIFPPMASGAFTMENFEDDGESEAYKMGGYGGWSIEVEADTKSVLVRVSRFGTFTRLDPEPRLILPEGEMRTVSIAKS